MFKKLILVAVVVLFVAPCWATAQKRIIYKPDARYRGQSIWDIASVKEENVDIGLWALIVAKEYDSTVNVQANLTILDSMVAEIRRMLAGRTTDMDKFLAVRMFMFDPGPWNNNHPFDYDLDDPTGEHTENKLLSTYLKTRKGNCVSMPTLMLALMERIDPNVQLFGSVAPRHVFCRYHDRQTKDVFNVEPTNGGNPARNEWMIQQNNISQRAIDKGTYLRDLSKKEFIAVLIGSLVTKSRREQNYRGAILYANFMAKIAPNLISSVLQKLVAESILHDVYAYQNKAWKRGEAPPLTDAEQTEWHTLHESVIQAMKEADDMGYSPQTDEDEKRYRETVEAEKERRRHLAPPNQ